MGRGRSNTKVASVDERVLIFDALRCGEQERNGARIPAGQCTSRHRLLTSRSRQSNVERRTGAETHTHTTHGEGDQREDWRVPSL